MSNQRRAAELVAAVRRATRWIRGNMDLDAPSGWWGDTFGFDCPTEALDGSIQTVNFGRLLDRGPPAPGQEVFLRQFRSRFRRLQEVVELLRTVDAVLADRAPETELVSKFFNELCEFDLYRFQVAQVPTRYLDPEIFMQVKPTYEVIGESSRISSRLLDDLDTAVQSAAGAIIANSESVTTAQVTPAEEARNCFRRGTGDWTVRYGSGSCFALKRCNTGATYLHYLLRRPGQQISIDDLEAAWSQCKAERHGGGAVLAGSAGRSGHDGEVIDETGQHEIWKALKQIESDLEKAKQDNDLPRVETLQIERHQIQEALRKARKPNGNPVLLGDQTKRARDRVTKAIRRVINEISNSDRDLGLHLEDCVKTGPTCRYSPSTPVTWET